MKTWGPRRGMLPSLTPLLAVEAAERLGNFRAAAEDMGVTQGAVAQQVRALEGELGRPLFLRHARGLTALDATTAYVERVRLALGIIEEATRDLLRHDSSPEPERLTVSMTPAFASRWLMPRLSRLAEALPDLDVMMDASDILRPLSGRGRVDLAIRWGMPPFGDGVSRLLLPGTAVAVCAPALMGGRSVLSVDELSVLPLISDSHGAWARWFETYAPDRQTRIRGPVFSHTNLAIEAAQQGMGVALVPEALLQEVFAAGTLVAALPPEYRLPTGRAFYCLMAEDPPQGSALARLADWLSAQAVSSGSEGCPNP